jgi:hypothetical protein
MKLKFLYTLGLLICLSNFASPNECARNCPGAKSSRGAASSADAACSTGPAASSTAPAASAPDPSAAAATQTAAGQGEPYSPTLIKLLYI